MPSSSCSVSIWWSGVRHPSLTARAITTWERGVNPGYPLHRDYPELADGLLVAITEQRTRADIDRFAEVLEGALSAELQAYEEVKA